MQKEYLELIKHQIFIKLGFRLILSASAAGPMLIQC
ncbi:hypothetical protein BA6E_108112 [Bacteroidales bacterium 6E]|nr:hypothetical protein BA6E_108112 [Bacteroidales bacterium 6E]